MKNSLLFVLLLLLPAACLLGTEAYILDIDDVIGPVTHRLIQRVLQEAEQAESAFVVIRLNTPGGLATSMEKILIDIVNAPVCVVVYVWPGGGGANSAGVFIVAAADIAAMAPQTNIGSAHPVTGQGKDIEKTLSEKITNAMIAKIKAIATHKQRNINWYEQAVRESVNITSGEALELNVIDLVARDLDDLLTQIDGKEITKKDAALTIHSADAKRIVVEKTFAENMLTFLQNPNVFMILLSLGFLGLFIEFTHPGSIFPGVLGGVFLLLGFFSGQVLPINTVGVLLILLAFVFFVVELLRPGFGIFGIGGILAFVFGGLMLMDTSNGYFSVSLSLIIGIAVGLFIILAILLSASFKVMRRKPYLDFARFKEQTIPVRRVSAKAAYIYMDGTYWKIRCDEPLTEEDSVRILEKDGPVLVVKKV